MDRNLLTVAQTASYLQLSEKTVRRLIDNGQIQASKISNRSWRIRYLDIEKYISMTSNKHIIENKSVCMPTNNAPRLISLFSGCGGMDVGFKNAGFDILIDSVCQEGGRCPEWIQP